MFKYGAEISSEKLPLINYFLFIFGNFIAFNIIYKKFAISLQEEQKLGGGYRCYYPEKQDFLDHL